MNLYEHCFSIIRSYHKNYTEDKSEKDMSSYSNFMVNKVLSMDYYLLDLAEYMNKYIGVLSEDDYIKAMSSTIPNNRYDLTYKGKKTNVGFNEVIEKISILYDIPYKDAEMYYDQLSREQIAIILKKFGIEDE